MTSNYISISVYFLLIINGFHRYWIFSFIDINLLLRYTYEFSFSFCINFVFFICLIYSFYSSFYFMDLFELTFLIWFEKYTPFSSWKLRFPIAKWKRMDVFSLEIPSECKCCILDSFFSRIKKYLFFFGALVVATLI